MKDIDVDFAALQTIKTYISSRLEKKGLAKELIELVLWQRYCYEVENDFWQYTEGKCKKCGSNKLYLKEVPEEDYEDRGVCKNFGTEFLRD